MTLDEYRRGKLEVDELQKAVANLIAERAPASERIAVGNRLKDAVVRFEQMIRNATPDERKMASVAIAHWAACESSGGQGDAVAD